MRRLLLLVCLAFLAACTTTVEGKGTPAPPPAVLGFRVVVLAEEPQTPEKRTPPPPTSASPAEIDKARAARQNVDVDDQAATRAAFAALDCTAPDPLRGHDDPARPLITCDPTMPAKYALGPAFITGAEVAQARAQPDSNGIGYVVNLTFTSKGAQLWGDFTAQNVGKQVAILIDTQVLSAPTIQEAILGGDTVISGGSGGFTKDDAEQLALRLGSR